MKQLRMEKYYVHQQSKDIQLNLFLREKTQQHTHLKNWKHYTNYNVQK